MSWQVTNPHRARTWVSFSRWSLMAPGRYSVYINTVIDGDSINDAVIFEKNLVCVADDFGNLVQVSP